METRNLEAVNIYIISQTSIFVKKSPCNTVLKKVKIESVYKLKPYKTYPYMPLIKSLSRFLSKEILCKHVRNGTHV